MKAILLLLIISLFFSSISSKDKIDTIQYVIIKFNKEKLIPFNKKCIPATININEINEIYTLVGKCLEKYQLSEYQSFKNQNPNKKVSMEQFKIDLKKYKFQLIPVINSNKEKEVWVNCFCNNNGANWKKNIVFVLDGGKCFFNLKVNLTKHIYYDFFVNGEA